MKKIIFIVFCLINVSFGTEYSVVAYVSNSFDIQKANKFIKRFPEGIIEKGLKRTEYKIGPFKNYTTAEKFLKKVKKYYKNSFILKYKRHYDRQVKNNYVKIQLNNKNILVKCRTKCGCVHKNIAEQNLSEIYKTITINVKKYLFEINFKNINNVLQSNQKDINKSICLSDVENYVFYIDLYGNVYNGQKIIKKFHGNSQNIKLGIMYEKSFLNNWKFVTDDRVIISIKNTEEKFSKSIYLDINEFYIRSYCLYHYFINFLIGRKKTSDFRSWWYDAPLDEIKVFNENSLVTYQMILAGRINDETITDSETEKTRLKHSKFFIFHANYEYFYRNNIGVYYLYEYSRPETYILKRNIYFTGFDANGYKKNIYYWANVGFSNGKIYTNVLKQNKSGYGFDIGFKIPYSYKISFAASYALGSANFTQPYIATDYSDYLSENFSFRYYGNVLNPTLENINIFSLYAIYGIDTNKKLIVQLHHYKQTKVQQINYNDEYFYSTDGKSNNIGNELDITYQLLHSKQEKFKFGAGVFLGGDAYKYLNEKNAYKIFINYRYYWK